ncbi:MAG: hypothetical protein KBA66_22825 [Leptospiraceae bacterium]|nr:hypothetical protein [Leptospiraceae bacterium]
METTLSLKQISKQALSLNGLQRAKLAERLVISLDNKTLSKNSRISVYLPFAE